VIQIGHDKETDVTRLTAALAFAGAPVVGVILTGASQHDETLGIPHNFTLGPGRDEAAAANR
jgi:hypothetical protein